MTNRSRNSNAKSKREQEYEKLLEEAYSQPGVRDLMQIFENWQDSEKVLGMHRAATSASGRVVNTYTTNFDPTL